MANVSKKDREANIQRVYLHLRNAGDDGMKTSELEQQLGISERTLRDYLSDLASEGKIYKEGWYWFVDRDYVAITLRPLTLEAEEAMVLYLASRLFVKASDTRNTAAERVLEKLASILQADADVSQDIAQAATQLAQRPHDENYQDIFRAIMRGYLHRCPIRIVYRPYKTQDLFETTIHPYLLEPSAIGFATYVIGYSSLPNALRTYKIERIVSAKLLHRDTYIIPADFEGLAMLDTAWSIYYGDETLEVTLRFHPDVAKRVRETNWHPSQRIEDDPKQDGYLLLQITVADTTDLIPWIRTWGANCEVLSPDRLRDELMGEARRFAELYGWVTHRGAYEQKEDDPYDLDTTLGNFFG